MVKRIVDNVVPSATDVASTRQRCKRRRTEDFMHQTANFRTVLDTCRFFESHLLPILDIETSEVIDSDSLSISNEPSPAKVLTCLRQSMANFETTHELYCSQLRQSAAAAIQLTDTFLSLSAGINSEGSQTNTSPLTMLNLGPDATNYLKQEISDYAGVPSPSDLRDWQSLDSLLR